MNDLLLIELGFQELPARHIEALLNHWTQSLSQALDRLRLTHQGIRACATPRRLVWWVEACSDHQAAQTQERLGPWVNQAFDSHGQPTPACLGFARSCGVKVSDLERIEDVKGERLVHRQDDAGQPLAAVAQALLDAMVQSSPSLRTMRWGDHAYAYLRPAQWLCVRYGSKTLPLNWCGWVGQAHTYGHRFHHPEALAFDHARDYESTLAEQGWVLVDQTARRQRILEQLQALSPGGGQVDIDDALLDEVVYLVEWPVAMSGGFDARYLALPPALLRQVCRAHQRCFVVVDAQGALLPHFVTVANIASQHPESVVRGNERVIAARLSDAWFFMQQDLKKTLAEHAKGLASLEFAARSGTLADKVKRVALALEAWYPDLDAHRLVEAAKADLCAEVVMEFPELHGVMGAVLARKQGWEGDQVLAIEEHIRPEHAQAELPCHPLGWALAVVDRVDTLVALMAAGFRPTGEKDPYGLRRVALGLVRLLWYRPEDRVSLRDQVVQAASRLDGMAVDVEACVHLVQERLRFWLMGQGMASHRVACVMPWADDLGDARLRLEALDACAPEALACLAGLHKRVQSLLKQQDVQSEAPVTRVWSEPEEVALAQAVGEVACQLREDVQAQAYGRAMAALLTLQRPLTDFFDGIMVMVDDPVLRAQRLGLLREVSVCLEQIVAVSALQTS